MAKLLLLMFFTLYCLDWKSAGVHSVANVSKRSECVNPPRKLEGCEKTGYTKNDTYFYLFTQNSQNPEFLHDCGRKLPKNTNFDANSPTEIIIHGFLVDMCNEAWPKEMKDELLKRGDSNVILLDWGYYAIGRYGNALRRLKQTAKETVELIDNIKMQTNVTVDNLHIIGFSLGAHIAGLVGQETKIGRITGLDPAKPGFTNQPLNEKLDRGDANRVDVIHTNVKGFLDLGYVYPMGHDDFYVNGASHQISCYSATIASFLKRHIANGIYSLVNPLSCFHTQSVQFYKASINPGKCQFIGKQCKTYADALDKKCDTKCNKNGSNCSVMGMDWIKFYKTIQNQSRIFRVKTLHYYPYCIKSEMD